MRKIKAEDYEKMASCFRKSENTAMLIRILDRMITIITFVSYPLLLAYLYFYHRELMAKSILIPAFAFVAVTLFRRLYNAPRPYEALDIEPIIHKDTVGKSFPSRHVFSIFMIGMTYLQIDRSIAGAVFIMGIALSVIRVFGGVHYIRDVVCGAAVGIAVGIVGYFLL